MTNEQKLEKAVSIFTTLCDAIDERGWSYERDEEDLSIDLHVTGQDLPIRVIFIIDIDRQMIKLYSPLSFKISDEKRIEGAVAVCCANDGLVDGSFTYDIDDGSVIFKLTMVFENSEIGKGLFDYMINCAIVLVDKYNDKFLALNKGYMSFKDFIE